jgi:hypothetical protein
MFPEIGPGLLAGLSEGQRTIAHLLILLAVPVVAGLVYLIRRRVRRRNQTQRIPEEH